MACEVYNRLLIGGGHVFNGEFVVVGERVNDSDSHFAGESLFAVRTHIFKNKGVVVHLERFPNLGVESALSAMQ